MGCGAAKLAVLAVTLESLIHASTSALPEARSSQLAWVSMFAFGFQLYLVLSGVTDLYLGCRQLLGRSVVEVFGAPFWATGFQDFWGQWNRAWPNSASPARRAVLNFALVLLVVVIGRGVSAGTAVWAGLHLLLLGVEHKRGRSLLAPLPPPVRAVLILALIFVSGILLFMPTLAEAWLSIRRLFEPTSPTVYSLLLDAVLRKPWVTWCLWISGLVCVALPTVRWLQEQSTWRLWSIGGLLAGLLAALLGVPHVAQGPLTHWFREGNSDVYVGHDGWFYRQSELQRLTLRSQRKQVTGALLALAESLRGQSVPLLVVVVPDKAALYPEFILRGEYSGPVNPATHAADLASLRAAGVTVLDSAQDLWNLKRRFPLYFQRDSHWTPEAMKAVAQATAKLIHEKWPQVEADRTPIVDVRVLERADVGDLARQLAPWAPQSVAEPEQTQLVSISGLAPQADSPVSLLGGELLQVFDDPSLSFGNATGDRQQAGFGARLAAFLGRALALGPAVEAAEPGDLAQTAAKRRLVIALVRAGDL